MKFESGNEAKSWFLEQLRLRNLGVTKVEQWKVYAGRNRWAYPEVIFTDSHEAYFFKFWREKYVPDRSEDIRAEHIKVLDERIKYCIRTFGNEDLTTTTLNESTIIKLLELESNGITAYIVTVYGDGTALWCRAEDFYNFAMRYGTYLTFSRAKTDMNEDLPYRLPTGWFKNWGDVLTGFPQPT